MSAVAPHPNLLEVEDLTVSFPSVYGRAECVRGVSLTVRRGEVLAIVGESGSGKSLTAKSILRLVDEPGRVQARRLTFDDLDVLSLSDGELRRLRGGRVGMVFQDPMGSLNPTFTIGSQIVQVLRAHRRLARSAALARAEELLSMVGIAAPREALKRYPHELSGGMRQRVMIAMALSCEPELLIADEPTTALDVTIQAQILELLLEMRDRLGMAVVLITHDLGVVARGADRVAVMYAGRVVETAGVDEIFARPRHPYMEALLSALPRLHGERGGRLAAIDGAPPEAYAALRGCPFAPRCPLAIDRCRAELPLPAELAPGHAAACWRAGEQGETA